MSRDTYKKLGLIGMSLFAGIALTLAAQLNLRLDPSAIAAEQSAIEPPQGWTLDSLNAMELDELGEIDWITVKSGNLHNAESSLFEGENIVVVWEAGPALLLVDTPTTYDEFVVVLKGELILSDNDGNTAAYKQGDMFMLPKGFTGTWKMTEEYRELIVVDTESYNAS